eukprot:644587-Prymnesium_polylepis.1
MGSARGMSVWWRYLEEGGVVKDVEGVEDIKLVTLSEHEGVRHPVNNQECGCVGVKCMGFGEVKVDGFGLVSKAGGAQLAPRAPVGWMSVEGKRWGRTAWAAASWY